MENKSSSILFKKIYPSMRYALSAGRKSYRLLMNIKTNLSSRPLSSPVIPNAYTVHNTSTVDSDIELSCLEGTLPKDISGSLFICQCLGDPEAFMVGDTNIVRIDFKDNKVSLKNRFMFTPATIAGRELQNTTHRFDFMGMMYLSPGLGMYSYTEGMYLFPDGRIGVTSDVDRPWIIDRENLKVETPLGRRDEWLPMMSGSSGDVMGTLFAGYNNSHVVYTDNEQGEVFLANYQYKQPTGEHPVHLIRWDGYNDFEKWSVVNENDEEIEIKQSIHELVFTRDYILLADTAFVGGAEMFTPWKNAPLPYDKTVVYIINRKDLCKDNKTVKAKCVEIDEPCIHLIPEYENPEDKITLYMLQTPATNTAELLRSYDKDLEGNLFPKFLIGYGTLPVLDLSSVGKHVIDVNNISIEKSEYISEMPYCWGPYLYTYMGRQIKPYNGEDLFVMFKGFSKDMLPKRIYEAYKDVKNRKVPIEDMVSGDGINHNNSICRIATKDFKIIDSYILPDKVLLYTISCIDSMDKNSSGYVLAGIVTDNKASEDSSGHEYWLFDASNLSKGPICKLGHKSLNNSTLFHTVYIPSEVSKKLDKKETTYKVPIREDYKEEELKKWNKEVLEVFEKDIWPYFE